MTEAPERRWFQFTIRGMLLATVWAAVFCGALRLYNFETLATLPLNLWALVVFGLIFLVCISPPAAVAVLFGRTWWGVLVGVIVCALYIGWELFAH
jgi:hypothetical protein